MLLSTKECREGNKLRFLDYFLCNRTSSTILFGKAAPQALAQLRAQYHQSHWEHLDGFTAGLVEVFTLQQEAKSSGKGTDNIF